MVMGFLTNSTYTLNQNNEAFNKFYFIFELCLFIATFAFIPFVLIVIYLMWKYPQFHTNLVILISNLFISYGVMTVVRQMLFIEVYLCGDKEDCYENELFMLKNGIIAEMIKYTSFIAYFVAFNWIIIERIWAIINLKGYENKNDYKIIIISVIIQWVISGGGVRLVLRGHLPILAFLIPATIFSISTVLVFQYMDNKNKRKYRLSKSVGNAYTLSERYQLAENIKTSPLILTMTKIHTVLNLILFITGGYMIFSEDIITKQITKMIIDFLTTIYAPCISFTATYSIKKWRSVCIGLFVKKCHKIAPKRHLRETVTNIANCYVISPQLETDIYFQQLNNRWA